jgi:hypothetical protein
VLILLVDGPEIYLTSTDIIEAQRVGKLDEKHCAQVAKHAVTPRLGIDPGFFGRFMNDVAWNELEQLPKNIDMMTGWLGGGVVDWFRHCNPNQPTSRAQSAPFLSICYGMPVKIFQDFPSNIAAHFESLAPG